MWIAPFDARQRHPIVFFLIVLATHLLLRGRADGDDVVEDPARGPYDDRVDIQLPSVDWTVTAGENAATPAPMMAGALSGLGTASGAAVLAYAAAEGRPALAAGGAMAMAVGPSLGHWYAGRTWNPGLASRLGTALIAGAGVLLVVGCDDEREGTCAVGGDSLLLGAAGYVASTIYEITMAPSAARTPSRRMTRVVITPIRGQEQIVPGLALASRF
jgi:hypothetical protein